MSGLPRQEAWKDICFFRLRANDILAGKGPWHRSLTHDGGVSKPRKTPTSLETERSVAIADVHVSYRMTLPYYALCRNGTLAQERHWVPDTFHHAVEMRISISLTFDCHDAVRKVLGEYIGGQTFGPEYRIYQRQKKWWNPSAACILFVLCRYVTLGSIVMATAFFFGTNWTEKTCVPAVGGALRALSASIVSIIFMWRTWAIWCKNRPVLHFLMIAFIPTTVFTWGFVFNQVPEVGSGGSCGGLAGKGVFGAKWPFALANMAGSRVVWGIVFQLKLVSGLGYFFTSIALQVLNLIFLLSSDPAKQNTMITFTNAMTGLLSQRISKDSPSFDRKISTVSVTSLSQRVVSDPSTNEKSLSRSRWARGLQRPGLTGTTESGIELGGMGHAVSLVLTQAQVTNAENPFEYGTDGDSGNYANSVKGGAPV
ncbi:hypothetical protein C8R45DRAFT_933817 [Mycena sanguinolenta]|nr:hypothetical protein C8R45DRAFT_933817 [Mycena sanguinolenta]